MRRKRAGPANKLGIGMLPWRLRRGYAALAPSEDERSVVAESMVAEPEEGMAAPTPVVKAAFGVIIGYVRDHVFQMAVTTSAELEGTHRLSEQPIEEVMADVAAEKLTTGAIRDDSVAECPRHAENAATRWSDVPWTVEEETLAQTTAKKTAEATADVQSALQAVADPRAIVTDEAQRQSTIVSCAPAELELALKADDDTVDEHEI